MCLDSGAYMANLKCCCKCQSNQVSVLNKTISEDDGIEVTVFERKFSVHKFRLLS
jgi:hypothetical protein